MEEKQLVEAVLAGDEKARDRFYRLFYKRIYVTTAHFLGLSDPELEDVVQDTFVIAYQKLAGFQFRSGLYSWLNQICVNLCFDLIRKRKRTLLVDEDKFKGWMEARPVPETQHPDNQAIRNQQHSMFAVQLAKLDAKCRQLIRLRLEEEQPFAVIARSLGLRLGSVTARMVRCRKALEKLMKGRRKAGATRG